MSFHDQQYSEKRDFMRMKMETTATLTVLADNLTHSVQCQDLSNQGAQVLCPEGVSEGAAVELNIPSPTPGMKGLQAKGVVVRCQAEESGGHVIGVKFDSLD
ncbi:PilZ domain-containing protein [Halopseudomonas sabulinigri]|uniref:Cyclic di-GMP-binding protein PilZ n=1 Tax=Halopseudomonas sabulinigri TaxID=472181 RepID=A0A1H1NK36_9GAMM|nr:PilZ domain-containing protein [Halopseudomonas sabulinigri]SDR99220.1 PilZ domain-containing protein [Halopseudomonas sabulinigri]